jgi:hypothetical protein
MKFLLHALLDRFDSPAQAGEFIARPVKNLSVLAYAPTDAGDEFRVVAYPFGLKPQAVVNIAFEHPKFQVHCPFQSSGDSQQIAGLKGSSPLCLLQDGSYVAYSAQWRHAKPFQPSLRIGSFLQSPLNFLEVGGRQKSSDEFLRQFSSASFLKGFLDFVKLKDTQSPFVHASHLSLNLTPLQNKRNESAPKLLVPLSSANMRASV